MRACEEYGVQTIVVGGGVSANTRLRETLTKIMSDEGSGVAVLFPPPSLSTDNALMIAIAGATKIGKKYPPLAQIIANGNWRITNT